MNDPTPIADMVAEMMARGLSADVIVMAVRTAELARGQSGGIRVETAAEKRRAWDREYRRRKKQIHPNPPENPPDTNSALYLSSLSTDSESKEVKKERKRRGERIPPEWKPNVGHLAAGARLGFTEPQVFEQAEDMRIWAQSNEHRAVARKSNWNLTFLGWLRRNRPKAGAVNGTRNPTMAAFDDLIARAEGGEVEGGDSVVDVTPGRA